MSEFSRQYHQIRQEVLTEIDTALTNLDVDALERLSEEIMAANHVFFVGVGRVMLSMEAMAKRFAHLGIATHCVGDITEPAITEHDLLIVGSGSGASIVPLVIARKAKSLGAKVIHIGSNPDSEMNDIAEFMVRIPVRTRLYLPDEIEPCQIMTSLFEQVLLLTGDILAKLIVDRQGIDMEALWEYHANLE